MRPSLILHARRDWIWTLAAALAMLTMAEPCRAYLTLYEGPTYDGTNGYNTPDFNHNVAAQLRLAPGELLNNAGTSAWRANLRPSSVDYTALRWQPATGPVVELDHLDVYQFDGSAYSYPYAINAGGTVVGAAHSYYGSFPISRPVRWDAGGTSVTAMQVFGSGVENGQPGYAHAWDINDVGYSVGWAHLYGGGNDLGQRPVRWDPSGNISLLNSFSSYPVGSGPPFPFSGAYGAAYAINGNNVAVGYGIYYDPNNFYAENGRRAVRWNAAGDSTQLAHLGTATNGSTFAEAWFVNDAGDAVGHADKYDGAGNNDGPRAVRWNNGSTTAIELETLGTDSIGVTNTQVYALNEAGTAVGIANEYNAGINQGSRAVLWDAAGQVTELGHLPGFEYSKAYDINAAGTAVGLAQKGAAENVAVYWDSSGNPVELSTLIAPTSGWTFYQALAISDTGWIVGIGQYDPPGAQGSYDRVFMLQVPIPVDLAGDYNGDNKVDAADYVVWRKYLNTNTSLPNDTTPGSVIAADYGVWRGNFGAEIGDGAVVAAVVPEPGCGILMALGAISILRRIRNCHTCGTRA